MITFKAKDFYYTNGKDRVEGECLSTDTKPTTYANGSVLIEMDTGDRFMFDEANEEWLNITNPGGGGDTGEVWLVGDEYSDADDGRVFGLSSVDEIDHVTELFNNADSYNVYLNNTEMFLVVPTGEIIVWSDSTDESATTKLLKIRDSSGVLAPSAQFFNISTAPTSVEVSVKAK